MLNSDTLKYYSRLLSEQQELIEEEKRIVLSGEPREFILSELKRVQSEYKKLSNKIITVFKIMEND